MMKEVNKVEEWMNHINYWTYTRADYWILTFRSSE